MARVTGIGGVFLKAKDPKALSAWYVEHLGMVLADYGGATLLWSDEVPKGTGMTTWSLFPADTKHFGAGPQTAMINYRVDDLDGLLAKMTAAGVEVDPKREEYEFGKFGWVTDPEGNRIELWQPLAEAEVSTNVPKAVPFFDGARLSQSLQFYVDGLGFAMTKRWEPRGRLTCCWLELGTAALILQESRAEREGGTVAGAGVCICFQCADALELYQGSKSVA